MFEGDEAAAAIQVGVEDSNDDSSDVSTMQAPSSSSTSWMWPSSALMILFACYWNLQLLLDRWLEIAHVFIRTTDWLFIFISFIISFILFCTVASTRNSPCFEKKNWKKMIIINFVVYTICIRVMWDSHLSFDFSPYQ